MLADAHDLEAEGTFDSPGTYQWVRTIDSIEGFAHLAFQSSSLSSWHASASFFHDGGTTFGAGKGDGSIERSHIGRGNDGAEDKFSVDEDDGLPPDFPDLSFSTGASLLPGPDLEVPPSSQPTTEPRLEQGLFATVGVVVSARRLDPEQLLTGFAHRHDVDTAQEVNPTLGPRIPPLDHLGDVPELAEVCESALGWRGLNFAILLRSRRSWKMASSSKALS